MLLFILCRNARSRGCLLAVIASAKGIATLQKTRLAITCATRGNATIVTWAQEKFNVRAGQKTVAWNWTAAQSGCGKNARDHRLGFDGAIAIWRCSFRRRFASPARRRQAAPRLSRPRFDLDEWRPKCT